ncbi:MAG: tetratricopeptide repeat protein [bacterium]|nr:tetratricopeptide repeat protein [bacterium]
MIGNLSVNRNLTVLFLTVLAFALAPLPSNGQSHNKTQQAVELFNQGQDAHEKGDLPAALGFYEKALEAFPEFPEAEVQRGNALLALKRPDDAEKAFRRALELREDWTLAMSNLGSLLVLRGKYAEAEKLLSRSLESDVMNQAAIAAMADLRLRTNADEKVLRDLLAKLSSFSGNVRPTVAVLSAKAAIELRLKENAEAKSTARRVVDLDPKNAAANLILAEVALMERDPNLGESYVDAAENAGSVTNETKRLRAVALTMKGKKAEALTLLESIDTPSDAVKVMIADIKDGDVADLTGLEAKVQRTPEDINALTKLCHGLRVSNPLKAIEYCRRASTLEPNELSHAIGFGAALVQAKQFEQAAVLFRKLLTIAPENATIRANLGTALFQLKRYAEAKAEFRWLTEKQPESAAAFYFLGIVYDQLGEYFDALATYQQFLRIADAEKDKLDIEKVNLRMPAVQRLSKERKGRKSSR